jgi:hypothetical protein
VERFVIAELIRHDREDTMTERGYIAVTLYFLLAACAQPSTDAGGKHGTRCLYSVKYNRGHMLKWGPCESPPAMATRRWAGATNR